MLSCWISAAAVLIGPDGPVICAYSTFASAATAFRRASSWRIAEARLSPWVTSAWRAGATRGSCRRRPRAPELAEERADAVLAGLVERGLDVAQRSRRRRVSAERHLLAAELEVEEVAAHAPVRLDLDALPDEGTGAVGERARADLQRVGGDEGRLLPRVADGVRVGDVVRRDVEAALLREQAAQRGLEAP
jgi:hypothetical protein